MKLFKVFTAIIFLASNFILAQNFNDAIRVGQLGLGSGARSLGMGNAYIAVGGDFYASYSNPATLGIIKNSSIVSSINYSKLKNDVRFFNSKTNSSESSTDFGGIGAVVPFPTFRGSFVVALGYNEHHNFNNILDFEGFNSGNNSLIQDLTFFNDDIPYLLGLSYPIFDINDDYIEDVTEVQGQLQQSGKIIEEGNTKKWNLSGAIEIAPNLFVGATFNIISGEYKRVKDYYEDDVNDIYPSNMLLDPDDDITRGFETFYLNDIIDWDINGYEAMVGVFNKVNKNLSIGATIKFPSVYQIKENFYVSGSSTFLNGDGFDLEPDESEIEYDISTPYEFGGGAAFNMNNITISGEVKLIDYSTMEFTAGFTGEEKFDKNNDIKETFDNTFNYNLGVEYRIPKYNLSVRGGYIFNKSPFKNDPSKFDKKYITAGVGFVTSKVVKIDVAYAHGWFETIGDNYDVNVSRTFQDKTTNKLLVNMTYQF